MSCGYVSCAPVSLPSCTVPSYIPSCVPACSPPISYPVGGLGSLSSCAGLGYPGGALSLGGGGGAASASSLGILAGANVGCVSQAPPSEVVIQPSPCVVTIPGPILSASCEPARVGGYSACGGGGLIGGGAVRIPAGSGRLGGSSGLYRPSVSRRMSLGNVCGLPC